MCFLSTNLFSLSPIWFCHLSTALFFSIIKKINSLPSSPAHYTGGLLFLFWSQMLKIYGTYTYTHTCECLHTQSSQNDLIQMQVMAFKSKIFGPGYKVSLFSLWQIIKEIIYCAKIESLISCYRFFCVPNEALFMYILYSWQLLKRLRNELNYTGEFP